MLRFLIFLQNSPQILISIKHRFNNLAIMGRITDFPYAYGLIASS